MTKKLICFSFEKDSMGGFCTLCNGVDCNKPGHISKMIAIHKDAFLNAVKDRALFSKYLGIEISQGWQNALADAIEPFRTMKDNANAELALKAMAGADLAVRGEEKVTRDMKELEVENEKLEKAIAEDAQKKKAKSKKRKEVKNVDTVDGGTEKSDDTSSEVPGSGTSADVSVEQGSTEDTASGVGTSI